MWKKEKLLVMSNFSFSHSVFKRLVLKKCKNQGLFGKGLNSLLILTDKTVKNHAPQRGGSTLNQNILLMTKEMKGFAGNKFNMCHLIGLVYEGLENFVGKGEC